MAVFTASKPASVLGLPLPADNFPRRFRNRAPLIIRQIVLKEVLEQWSSDPQHVTQALGQSVQTGDQSQLQQQADQQLPVMVAEDTKNFMDNPQFTKKIAMTAGEIVARVLVQPSLPTLSHSGSVVKEVSTDMFVPDLHLHDAQTLTHATAASCPLCESQANEQANFDNINNNHGDSENNRKDNDSLRRFYYRGVVPSSLFSDLRIPDLLASLSLAGAFNKDLMRIWMSLAGATTPLHYDRCHGILIQLVGRKRFVVFSHEDTNNIYPYDGITGPGHASKVRGLGHCFPFAAAARPSRETPTLMSLPASLTSSSSSLLSITSHRTEQDTHLMENMAEVLERWPKVRNTDPWIIDLEPGDALYTPPGFWHEVTSVDNSISVTVAWDMDANELQHVPRHMF